MAVVIWAKGMGDADDNVGFYLCSVHSVIGSDPMLVPIRYMLFAWTPPSLTLREQIELGRWVSQMGLGTCVNEYAKQLEAQAVRIDKVSEWPGATWFEYVVVAVMAIGLLSASLGDLANIARKVGVVMVSALPVIALVYYGSLWWTKRKLRKWLATALRAYGESET